MDKGEIPEGLTPPVRNDRSRSLIERFSLQPRENLSFQLLTTEAHDALAYPHITSAINELLAERGNICYELALVEGANRNTDDAKHIITEGVATRIEDPFYNPLSYDAFQLFRWSEKFKEGSMVDAAARYVGRWLAYAQPHDHSFNAMNREFRKVFEPFKQSIPDYLKLVQPYLDRLKRELGEEGYTRTLIEDFQTLMGLVNQKTAENIAKITEKTNGEVLIYCGRNHKAAVEEATRLIQTQTTAK